MFSSKNKFRDSISYDVDQFFSDQYHVIYQPYFSAKITNSAMFKIFLQLNIIQNFNHGKTIVVDFDFSLFCARIKCTGRQRNA
jgi:hypothetical protein